MYKFMIFAFFSIFLFQPIFVSAGSPNDTLAITTTSGELSFWQKGINYIALPSPPEDSLIIQPITSCEEGIALKIILQADSGSNLAMKLGLPTKLQGYHGASLSCSFLPNSIVRVATNEWLNPNDTITFQLSPTGLDTFYLGIQVTVPAAAPAFPYLGYVSCYVRNIETGDSMEVSESYYAFVSTPIVAGSIKGTLNNLSKNIAYTLDPELETVAPIVRGSENGTSMIFSIAGEPGEIIIVSFNLPSTLSGPTSIPCSFYQSSGYEVESGYRFNPNASSLMFLLPPLTGNLNLRLGITVNIPPSTPDGEYADTIHITACYSGLRRTMKARQYAFSCIRDDTSAIYTINIGSGAGVRDEPVPQHFMLHQNYPNPFNPSTTIWYELPRASFVTFKVYNVLGQEVATLVNERREAGKHTVEFNAGGLPSGVYFYRLQAGSFTQTKKLLLLR
ncbi:MAG: T9SS type A sorting domain-containing protein [Bacteroidota bacterium]|nr:T9SS type A sorting domain-containing protein [Bacteroidota bacterium]